MAWQIASATATADFDVTFTVSWDILVCDEEEEEEPKVQ